PYYIQHLQLGRRGRQGPRPSEVRGGLERECPDLDRLVGELLCTDLEMRPASAREVERRLKAIVDGFGRNPAQHGTRGEPSVVVQQPVRRDSAPPSSPPLQTVDS